MQQTFSYIRRQLGELYSADELRSIAFMLVERATGLSRTQVLVNKDKVFSDEERNIVGTFVEKLKKGLPVQYVLGEADFYGLCFAVGEAVLIPRPETEELVEWVLADCRGEEAGCVLDIGTGSGCIAVTLKTRLPGWQVEGWDVSEQALALAEANARRHGAEVRFARQDILCNPATDRMWEVVVSNPPYIPRHEQVHMSARVTAHEPELALFVPDDCPLLFYEAIARFALRHLTPGGRLYFEIHYDAGAAVTALLRRMGFTDVELRRDLAGRDRMVRATLSYYRQVL